MEILNKLISIDLNYFIVALMVIFYSLEQILATQFKFDNRPKHQLNNLLFQATFYIIGVLYATVTVTCIEWLNNHKIGLFYLIEMPTWLKLFLGVAMIDMVTYWFHRFAHVFPIVWRFHRIHHSDTTMDASSNFRGHPFESIFWFGVSNIVAAGIFGLDLFTLGLYFLIATPFFFLEHSNLRFPTWLDKTIGLIITTPNLHKIHHDQDQSYTDSNFADIFILWDRLFGTFKYKPVEQIKLGLAEFDSPKKQNFWFLMISPFVKIEKD